MTRRLPFVRRSPRSTSLVAPAVLAALVATSLVGGCSGASTDGASDGDGGGGGDVDGGAAGGQDGATPSGDGASETHDGSTSSSHAIKTIFLVVMENHNWSTPSTKVPQVILGNASAKYINQTLLPMSSYCDNYFDNPKSQHPSEPNYIWLEAGDNLGIINDNDPAKNHKATTAHLVTQMKAAGVSWHSYQEDVTAGTCPVVSSGLYAAKHNPMVFFDDVIGTAPAAAGPDCIANVRPYTELAGDLTANKVARYDFITPNLCNDMHDSTGCTTTDSVKNGDTWLAAEIPKILASQAYKDNGALFITWDESEGGEYPIGMIVLSPLAKGAGYVGHTKYYHSSMVRTVQEIFGLGPLLADAANQPSLRDLFTTYP